MDYQREVTIQAGIQINAEVIMQLAVKCIGKVFHCASLRQLVVEAGLDVFSLVNGQVVLITRCWLRLLRVNRR
ncbi:hypothetical protein [Marinospirillum insulare]|uniref:hypothetical protein n=1 Tax=Marinospirillum insulare TaxID=217169 RepID=UPI0012375305|nr:hypothetical protein [Marinospirillum insulare]